MSRDYEIHRTRTIAECERLVPHFRRIWDVIKLDCRTRQRCPKTVILESRPTPAHPNDYDCCSRYALELATGRLSRGVHVSAGECAIMNRGEEAAVAVPPGYALITCAWNDHYRTFTMTVQAAPGELGSRGEPARPSDAGESRC